MPYVIKKNGKYLKGTTYTSGLGYRFRWTKNPNEAREFDVGHALRNLMAQTHGRAVVKSEEVRLGRS